MNHYVTGTTIKRLREGMRMTQTQLAERLNVSDKTISKWETCKGFPDISLLEPLAKVLRVSVPELLSGEQIINTNRSANLKRMPLYVCPVCGNILCASGNALISCCGITLPPMEAEPPDANHALRCDPVEDEFFLSFSHEMTKQHYISFVAFAASGRFELVKLYPEGNAETRMTLRRGGMLYWYCNRHGLFCQKI